MAEGVAGCNTEEWRPVVGYEGVYEVSDQGRVRRCGGGRGVVLGRVLQPRFGGPPKKRYHYVNLSDRSAGKVGKHSSVHTLVAKAFLGPRPEGLVVNHIDGVKTNNAAGNLEYVTNRQNCFHASVHGLRPGRLSPDQVRDVRKRLKLANATTVARDTGIPFHVVNRIAIHRTYLWVG